MNIRLPAELKNRLDALSHNTFRSLNTTVLLLLTEALDRQDQEGYDKNRWQK